MLTLFLIIKFHSHSSMIWICFGTSNPLTLTPTAKSPDVFLKRGGGVEKGSPRVRKGSFSSIFLGMKGQGQTSMNWVMAIFDQKNTFRVIAKITKGLDLQVVKSVLEIHRFLKCDDMCLLQVFTICCREPYGYNRMWSLHLLHSAAQGSVVQMWWPPDHQSHT